MTAQIHRIADAKAATIVDRFGNFMGRTGKGCKIVIEGADITHECYHATETTDGMLTAKCFLKRNGEFVFDKTKRDVERITRVGRGHIFYAGCCR